MKFLAEDMNKEIINAIEDHFTNHYFGGAGYILPDGILINPWTNKDEFETKNHGNIEDFLNRIGLSDKRGQLDDGSPSLRKLGAIRINDEEQENNYIELPEIRPTNFALYTLQDWLDKNSRKYKYIIVTGPNFVNDTKYNYIDYIPEDIIKRIKRYYTSGILYEDNDRNNIKR